MINLVINPRDPELEPLGPSADGSKYRPVQVTVATSRDVRLTAGGFVLGGAKVDEQIPAGGSLTVSVPATDGTEILAADRSTFEYVVTLSYDRVGRSRETLTRTFRGLLPGSLGATVQVTSLVNAAPVPPEYVSAQDLLDSIGGVESVSGVVDLDSTGAAIREFYCTGAATIEGVAFGAGTAVVFRREPGGAWGYKVVDGWTPVGGSTTTTTTAAGTTTTTTTAATTTTTTTATPEFPATLSGLIAWYSASDAATIIPGATMTWQDKSSNARHMTQATATKQPATGTRTLNGRNVLDFDGGDVLASAAFTAIAQPFTAAVVYKLDATPATNQVAVGGGGSTWLAAARSTLKWAMSTSSVYLESAGASDTAAHVQVGIFNTTTSALRIDGAVVGSGTVSTGTLTQVLAGAVSTTPGGAIDGCIAEIVIVAGVLAGADLTGLESYLKTKWGTP